MKKALFFLLAILAISFVIPFASAEINFNEITGEATTYSTDSELTADELAIAGMAILILFLLMLPIWLGIYVYSSFAYMALAKKTKTEPIWLAWIPVVRYYLIAKMANRPWWPIFLLIGYFVPYPFVRFACMIAFTVFFVLWSWKIFEKVGRPGWWSLFSLIPVVGGIVFLVLLGIAAWGKSPKKTVSKRKPKPAKRTKTKKRR